MPAMLWTPGLSIGSGLLVRPPGVGNPLLDDLLSFHRLDETSGVRVDSGNGYDLTDVNTVGYTAGKIGNAALFVRGSAEYLYSAGLHLTSAQSTVAFWVKMTASAAPWAYHTYFIQANQSAKRGFSVTYREGVPYLNSMWGDEVGWTSVSRSIEFVIGTWYFIRCWLDADGYAWMQANSEDPLKAATPLANPFVPETSLGAYVGAGISGTNASNSAMDLLGTWGRNLTGDEHTELFNGGAGFDPTA